VRGIPDPADARRWIAERRAAVLERLAGVEARLAEVRTARGDWTDEEHDPEGFTLTFEWQQAEGARAAHQAELDELELAAARVAGGSFGLCASCGLPIPHAQLELRPARTTCVSCAENRR
jgi:RNA polymerase-binding transcription factor DksA